MRTGLLILPIELICMIFENLEMPDLLHCTLVNSPFPFLLSLLLIL